MVLNYKYHLNTRTNIHNARFPQVSSEALPPREEGCDEGVYDTTFETNSEGS